MATYETDKSARSAISAGIGHFRQPVTDFVTVALTTAMINNADDDVGLLYVPAGAIIQDVGLSLTEIDTDGSPAVVVDVGDAADEDRLIAASTIGQAGGATKAIALAGFMHKYTTRTQLRLYIKTAAATPAAGTAKFSVTYVVDPDYVTTALTAA